MVKKDISLTILGIVAVLAIVGLVLLFNTTNTGKIYGIAGQEIPKWPQTFATEYCGTTAVDLSVPKVQCQSKGYEMCEMLNTRQFFPRGSAGSVCIKECIRDVRNQCQMAKSAVQSPPYIRQHLRFRQD